MHKPVIQFLEVVFQSTCPVQDRVAEFLRGALQNDITTVMSRSDMVVVTWPSGQLGKPRKNTMKNT